MFASANQISVVYGAYHRLELGLIFNIYFNVMDKYVHQVNTITFDI